MDLFFKTDLPRKIPRKMEEIVTKLKKSSNQEECLKLVYEILSAKYQGNRTKTYTNLCDVFMKNTNKLWKKSGFLHCTNMNFLARILLVKSGIFSENDIRLKWTQVWLISPHQYLQVKVGNSWKDVDIWARNFGIEFGDHAHGWH